jgi:hypothetical protein
MVRDIVNNIQEMESLKDTQLVKRISNVCGRELSLSLAGNLKRFLNRTVKTTSHGNLLWDFINNDELGKELLNTKRQEKEGGGLKSAFARELNKFFNKENNFNPEKLEQLRGHFVVYRRFFIYYDTHIMTMNLEFGIDEDPTKFELKSKFNDEHGEPFHDVIGGYVVAHLPHFFSLHGRIESEYSVCNMNLRMDPPDLPENNNPVKVKRGCGRIMVSTATRDSTSPIYISRIAEPITPNVFTIEEFKKDSNKGFAFRALEIK